MRPAPSLLAFVLASLLLAGCDRGREEGPIVVSVIGAPLDRRGAEDAPRLALRSATGLGLVRFDQAGQVIPGAAARWAIVDDGVDGIFRIDGATGVDAQQIAGRLRATLAAPGHRMFADGITRVTAVTDAVVELRLAEPRTDLLAMLADPVLATLAPEAGAFRAGSPVAGAIPLRPRTVPDAPAAAPVILHGERAGRAVAAFVAEQRQLVLGGTFADLPVARAAALPRGALRFDPATGLFGLAVTTRRAPFADEPFRRALSLALDRDRIVALIGVPGLAKATTIAGSQIEPALEERRSAARALLNGLEPPPLRLFVPAGPGAHLLFRLIRDDWAKLGIETQPARSPREADLNLIDQVLPPSERARAACIAAAGCDPQDKQALLAPAFLPIAQPVRWSLVAPDLDLFTENPLAQHPLDLLRTGR